LQPSFQIKSVEKGAIQYNECTLIIDVGERYFSFVLYSSNDNEFVALEYYLFSSRQKQEQLKELLSSHTMLQLSYPAVQVYFNSAVGLLIPERFYDEDSSCRMLELVSGDMHRNMTLSDEIEGLNMRNVYSVPDYLREMLISHFPGAVYQHLHTGLLKKNMMLERKDNRMEIIFYPERIIVSLWKDNALLFIQGFNYETPEDVAYHTTNLAEQWKLDRAEIRVIVSGLVEKDSALFASVDKYFQFVETEERPEQFNYDAAFDRYPAHFFSPLFTIGTCVS
jgi:hypothetical protein